jgi:type IX secretion system PorP/SprF family membrane protein
MKKLLIILFCTINQFWLLGQQYAEINEMLISKFSLSPAYAGSENSHDVFASVRQNWSGLAGAPFKMALSYNGPLAAKTGGGLLVYSDKFGIFQNNQFCGVYAHHFEINDNQNISFGLGLSYSTTQVNFSLVEHEIDPKIAQMDVASGGGFNASSGIVYRYLDFNAGFAVYNLFEKTTTLTSDITYNPSRYYKYHASFLLSINKKIAIEPYLILYQSSNMPLHFAALSKIIFNQSYWFSAGYTTENTYSLSIGAAIVNRIVFNYCFEYGSSGLMLQTSGNHEFSIGYQIAKPKKSYKKSLNKSVFQDAPGKKKVSWTLK